MNPIKGLVALPWDCRDIEWSDAPATLAAAKPKRSFADFEKSVAAVELPAKSLADTINDLVRAVKSYRRPVNPLAEVFSK